MTKIKRSIRDQLIEAETAFKAGETDRAVLQFASILAATKTNSRAAKFLHKIRKLKGTGIPLSQPQVNVAVEHFQRGDAAKSAQVAKSLIIEAPQEPVLFNIVGVALSVLEQNEEAIGYFRAATLLRPTYTEALTNLGTALLKTEQFEPAIAALKRALAQNGNYAEAHTNLGYAYHGAQRYEEALDCFDHALRLEPLRTEALNGKATTLQSLSRMEDVISLFQKGLEIEPNNFVLLVNISNARIAGEREPDAVV